MNEYIKNAFGLDFDRSTIKETKGLPLYLTLNRELFCFSKGGFSFVVVKTGIEEQFGVVALKKQLRDYEEAFKKPIAFFFDSITRTQRDSLISHQIPFISKSQLYLPFIGAFLQDSFKNKQIEKTDKMMPLTQKLFLYLLYKCKDDGTIKTKASKDLNMTNMSVTRASKQLEAMGLITQTSKGVEVVMRTVSTGKQLLDMAKPYLINPVKEEILIEYYTALGNLPIAGESALSEYSLLNAPKIKCVAVDKSVINKEELTIVDKQWEDKENLLKLQLFRYDPTYFLIDNKIDPISLFMSFEKNENERIDEAIEEMLGSFKW